MKPLLRVLAGEVVSPMPVWLMRQAGRYLPEYRALRERAGGFLALCLTPEWAAEITLQPVRRFAMDAAILFSDILMVPYGLGQALDYREGEGPVLDPIRKAVDLRHLSLAAVVGRLAPISETVRLVCAGLPEGCTLIGFAGGAWTVAAYMVEGKGGGDFEAAKRMAYGDPALFDQLIALIEAATIEYLCAQAEAGAEALQLFDSWAGLLDDGLFARYVIAPTRRIAGAVKARHPSLKFIGFPRMAGLNYPSYAAESGVDALGLDTSVPLSYAQATPLPTQGTLDPVLLREGGAALETGVKTIRDRLAGKAHIFNLGHGVSQHTDPDHVARLVEYVRSPC